MSSLKRDVTALHPEQKDLLDIFVKASYRHSYYDTFRTLLDYFIHEFTAPLNLSQQSAPFVFPSSYNQSEQDLFIDMRVEIQKLCKKYTSLHNGIRAWYDPFGCLFESVCSNFSKQANGQFFTPMPLCDLIAQITIPPPSEKVGGTCNDPCSGSGRLLLAANHINPSLYFIAVDIDPICAKMTAINMCLNGAVGEVSCNDGLWAVKDNFRFAFKVVPMVALFNESAAFLIMNFTHDIKKTYCLLPLDFENCMYQMTAPEQKETLSHQIQAQIEFRETIHPQGLQGILFDTEGEHIREGKKPKPTPKKVKSLEEILVNPILFNL
jgi:type I restriction enzyme M protein